MARDPKQDLGSQVLWRFEPLTGWRKAVAILWCGVMGTGLGVWAVVCPGGPEFDTPTGDLSLLDAINNLLVWYGLVMGLLWGTAFAKLQRSQWAWLTASIVSVVGSTVLPYRIDGHMYERATAIAFYAPLSFAAVHGLWLIPWRKRSWTDFVEIDGDRETLDSPDP